MNNRLDLRKAVANEILIGNLDFESRSGYMFPFLIEDKQYIVDRHAAFIVRLYEPIKGLPVPYEAMEERHKNIKNNYLKLAIDQYFSADFHTLRSDYYLIEPFSLMQILELSISQIFDGTDSLCPSGTDGCYYNPCLMLKIIILLGGERVRAFEIETSNYDGVLCFTSPIGRAVLKWIDNREEQEIQEADMTDLLR